jgi:hypothetical protein
MLTAPQGTAAQVGSHTYLGGWLSRNNRQSCTTPERRNQEVARHFSAQVLCGYTRDNGARHIEVLRQTSRDMDP